MQVAFIIKWVDDIWFDVRFVFVILKSAEKTKRPQDEDRIIEKENINIKR